MGSPQLTLVPLLGIQEVGRLGLLSLCGWSQDWKWLQGTSAPSWHMLRMTLSSVPHRSWHPQPPAGSTLHLSLWPQQKQGPGEGPPKLLGLPAESCTPTNHRACWFLDLSRPAAPRGQVTLVFPPRWVLNFLAQ